MKKSILYERDWLRVPINLISIYQIAMNTMILTNEDIPIKKFNRQGTSLAYIKYRTL